MAACQQLRSTSLPLRPHALVQELDDELQRLRSCAAASSASPCPTSLAARLGDAYGRIEELVQLPGGRDALSSARWRRAVESALDASVSALDLCERARDAAASAKQHARAARRAVRRGGDAALARAALRGYARCLANAGKHAAAGARKKKVAIRRAPAANDDAEAPPAALRVMSEAVAVTAAVLQRAMASLSARVVGARKSRWCAVARLLGVGGDWSLGACRDLDGEDAQEMLRELEESVEAVESGLEHLFRHIVQSRVALLNVLTL
ncbi:unnamed protein product [Urochloa decumbens]|uniref:Uncharacterized protein n=1 Tax=Urochloa decumbens TaxID=240449 RepID=A0ABC9FC40_9POAL